MSRFKVEIIVNDGRWVRGAPRQYPFDTLEEAFGFADELGGHAEDMEQSEDWKNTDDG